MMELSGGKISAGFIAPGLEAVASAFFSAVEHGEIGAACSIWHRGRCVLDVWGGNADSVSGRRWEAETLVPVYSISKGVAAVCVLQLAQAGLLDLDEPVAKYWPEFAEHGKNSVTVRQALAHRAGVPNISGVVTLTHLADSVLMATRLAAQQPVFDPGTNYVYHPITIGWIAGELVRRLTGKSFGSWVREHIATPLGIDLWFGIPATHRRRIAALRPAHAQVNAKFIRALPNLDVWNATSLNGLLNLVPDSGGTDFNDWRVQSCELAGAGLVTNARSLAKFYAACLKPLDGAELLRKDTLRNAMRPVSSGPDFYATLPGATWGTGFMLPGTEHPMWGSNSFGHPGFGGSLAFADMDADIAFAYVRNRITTSAEVDRAVYGVVDALKKVIS